MFFVRGSSHLHVLRELHVRDLALRAVHDVLEFELEVDVVPHLLARALALLLDVVTGEHPASEKGTWEEVGGGDGVSVDAGGGLVEDGACGAGRPGARSRT